MKGKLILLIIALFAIKPLFAQVGINTQTPYATIDIVATRTDATTAEGMIAPRLTLAEVAGKDAMYTTNQVGTIVYVTDVSGTTTTKTANISKIGYYYFDGSLWQAFNSGSGGSANDWSLTGNAGTARTTNYLGTTDATDLVLKTNSIERMTVTSAGNIGIGTTTPSASAALDVRASNKAIGIPNVALTGASDITTVPTPQAGMIVFNTTLNQLSYYDGTKWVQPIISTNSVVTPKLMAVAKSINSNTSTFSGDIYYDTKIYDPENAFTLGVSAASPARYVVTKAGLHQIFLNYTNYNTPTGGATWYLRIKKNGSAIAAIDATTASGASAALFAMDEFVVGDVITVDRGGANSGWLGGGLSKISVFRFE